MSERERDGDQNKSKKIQIYTLQKQPKDRVLNSKKKSLKKIKFCGI